VSFPLERHVLVRRRGLLALAVAVLLAALVLLLYWRS
jgi:hypothetical protein